jgi:hypothetical protein
VRFVLHLLLLVFITIKIFDWNVLNADYGRSMRRTFLFLFETDAMIDSSSNNQIFEYDEFYDALEKVLNAYGNARSISVSDLAYGYRDKSGGNSCREEPQSLTAQTFFWSDSTHLHSYSNEITSMNDFAYIFDDPAAYFNTLDSLHVEFDLCNYQQPTYSYLSSSNCNYWQIHITYKFIAQLYLEVEIASDMDKSCSGMTVQETLHDYISVIEIFTLITSLIYALYIIKVSVAIFLYLNLL